jgi:hypothetical protein
MKKKIIFLLIITTGIISCKKSIHTPDELLLSSTTISFEEIRADTTLFSKSWLVWFEQPIDHNHPERGSFKQRIWYSYKNASAPTVMVTEGYSATRNYTTELARLTGANQLIVEHRFFAESRPDSLDWQYLTVEQAANDHHQIIHFFKQLHNTKWATTGISKGGQTAIFHRAYFPDDVTLSVPYVAPINLAREDQRISNFFNQVGSIDDRNKIHAFQKVVLERRNQLMPLFKEYADGKNYTFRMGLEKAFDIIVLEYPFSFWQWGSQIKDIPSPEASIEELFSHLRKGSDIGYVSDQEWESIKPFFYQAYKELGYYAYVPGDLKPLIKGFTEDTISSSMFAPGGDTLRFIPTMNAVMEKLKKANPSIIAIIGENDPWGSTSLNNASLSNTIRAIAPNGSHLTRIKTLPEATQETVISKINQLLNE